MVARNVLIGPAIFIAVLGVSLSGYGGWAVGNYMSAKSEVISDCADIGGDLDGACCYFGDGYECVEGMALGPRIGVLAGGLLLLLVGIVGTLLACCCASKHPRAPIQHPQVPMGNFQQQYDPAGHPLLQPGQYVPPAGYSNPYQNQGKPHEQLYATGPAPVLYSTGPAPGSQYFGKH